MNDENNIEKVKCLLCLKEKGYSKEYSQLNNSHLGFKHHITVKEYKIMFHGKLVEYHPWDRYITLKKYKKVREDKISNSRLAGKELVVITKLNPIEVI